ncbi:hypothetical protein THAOC_24817 [Thalassiosira oceanica]|uniref:Uncharacterized protein n=1 Tax=Thalassiosira oceanica TaxID=159749 RepID=K0RNU2_THAOC|nr:hypothetical protein THAOC_24817 [Thalassiosira oceanica]|eukprot:EJK55453.1 hypothetical protein THAOC_24817 [Thalassiosira oceanica]
MLIELLNVAELHILTEIFLSFAPCDVSTVVDDYSTPKKRVPRVQRFLTERKSLIAHLPFECTWKKIGRPSGMLEDCGGSPSRSVLWTTDALRFGLVHPIASSYNSARQRVRTNPDRSWHPMSSFTFLPFGAKVCPSFLPTKACNRTVALSRTNLVDRPLAQLMEGAPAQGKGPNWTEPANTARPCAGPAGSPSSPSVPPKGFPLKGTTLHRTTFLSVGSKREDLQSMLEIFLGRKIDSGKFDLWVEPLLLARSLNWSSRAVCSCLVARAHHSQQTSATYARSSAGPRIHYLDAPQTQPSSARLQRQQAGRGRLKPGLPPGGPGPTQLAPVLVRRASIVAKCAPEGVPSGHEEGEARQLKTNPFPTQSYPTRKRQVQPISSNKPRDGRVGEKFVTSDAAEES